MIALTNEQAMVLGHAVHEQLQKSKVWPRILVFDLCDHRRILEIAEMLDKLRDYWPEDKPPMRRLNFGNTFPIGD